MIGESNYWMSCTLLVRWWSFWVFEDLQEDTWKPEIKKFVMKATRSEFQCPHPFSYYRPLKPNMREIIDSKVMWYTLMQLS